MWFCVQKTSWLLCWEINSRCWFQGLTVGGAQVSTKHAGFMVNINNATCEDYKNLIKKVQEEVFKHSGVKLECEVKVLGE